MRKCKISEFTLCLESTEEFARIIFARFIGEETVSCSNSLPELTDAPTWIIDPIDGTTNFVHSFPHTCISIALAVNKELEIGIIYNPVLEQLFTARKGHGAFFNQKPIKSSNVEGEKKKHTHTHTQTHTRFCFHSFFVSTISISNENAS